MLTPSAGGVQASYASIGINLALANAASNATASLTGPGTLDAGSVKVKLTVQQPPKLLPRPPAFPSTWLILQPTR
jgi:hypothetical protein